VARGASPHGFAAGVGGVSEHRGAHSCFRGPAHPAMLPSLPRAAKAWHPRAKCVGERALILVDPVLSSPLTAPAGGIWWHYPNTRRPKGNSRSW
jgi:hypothetical protein